MTDSGLERAIGKLEGQVLAMQEQIIAQSRAIEKSREESSSGRSRIYQELESIRQKATETSQKVEQVSQDLADNRPLIVEVKRWKERFIGMQMVIAAIAAMIGGAVAIFWKWIATKAGL
jgi:ElaB/YqjD/DUF883 family membrane-anchored ribosome-binding protein